MDNEKKIVLDIPAMTVIKVIGVLAGIVALYWIRDVLVMFFMVLVIVAALSPVVDNWTKKMPRQLAVALIYLIFLAVVVGGLMLVIPPVTDQIQAISQNIPNWLGKIAPVLQQYKTLTQASQQGLSSLSGNIASIGSSLLSTTLGVLGGVVVVITLLVLSFYLLLEEQGAKKFFKSILPPTYQESVIDTANKISIKMGAWLRGQLTLMLIVGTLDLIGLLILGIPYALTFALWAAMVESIAFVGPIIGAIPAVLVGFSISPIVGVLTIAVFVVVSQIEGQILVPKIMGKAVGLSPVVIILALLIGAKLLGILGIVLAVPAAGVISVIYEEWPKLRGFKE